ncbi:MAG: hypothetical protein OEY49_04075 [Candidatus Heimdallarchaeota archaeon]|nr:hypothetical protein [Candidatus Heimdallarchaeota archaeon]
MCMLGINNKYNSSLNIVNGELELSMNESPSLQDSFLNLSNLEVLNLQVSKLKLSLEILAYLVKFLNIRGK